VTIRRRLSLAAAIAVAVAVAVASLAAYLAVEATLRGQVDDALRERALAFKKVSPVRGDLSRLAARCVREPGLARRPSQELCVLPEGVGRFGGATGIFQITFPDGRVIHLPADASPLPAATESEAGGEAVSFRDETVDGQKLRVATTALDGGATLQVARPLDEVESALNSLFVILAVLAAAGIVLAALLGAAVSKTSLGPIRRFTERTESVTAEPGLGQRLPVESQDEIGRLAGSFNQTLAQLERSRDAQRQLVSDASHELRTPLTSLRANAELLTEPNGLSEAERRGLAADVVDQLDELGMLVDDVVELARRGEGGEIRDEIALDRVLTMAVARAARHAPEISFNLAVEPTTIIGAPKRIGRAVQNLLDNAAKWSPPGTTVEVRLEDGELTVLDQGPGFSPDDLPHVFDRFYRSASARSMLGSGLGLAIVKQVVEDHGGQVAAENAPQGGALLRVRLPSVDRGTEPSTEARAESRSRSGT
jgi:two-component system, OmpR family, sensor histidine kinase MprB